jgi:hypothetical protein
MQYSLSLILTALVAVVQSQITTFGGLAPVIPQGQWLPPTGSYSKGPYKQAILLSFDGMHQFDLVRYIAAKPDSAFAKIVKNAVVYSNARTSSPSDSLPGATAFFSGTSPRNSGIFWETVYDRSLYPPGSNCAGPQGTIADYSEAIDLNITKIDGGGGFNVSLLPQQKTSWGTCAYVYPHNFIRTNTVFEVGRGNGLVTAYADKHLAYEFLNGPSGVGLSQGYFPEVASFSGKLASQESWDDLHCESFLTFVRCQSRLTVPQGPHSAIGPTETGPTAPRTLTVVRRSTEPISNPSLPRSKRPATWTPLGPPIKHSNPHSNSSINASRRS